VLQLALVLRSVEVPFRFADELGIVDPPQFVAAGSNVFFPSVSLKRNVDGT